MDTERGPLTTDVGVFSVCVCGQDRTVDTEGTTDHSCRCVQCVCADRTGQDRTMDTEKGPLTTDVGV